MRDPSAQPVTVKDSNGTQSASPTRLIALDALGKMRQLALVHRVQGLTWNRDMGRFTGVLLVVSVVATSVIDWVKGRRTRRLNRNQPTKQPAPVG